MCFSIQAGEKVAILGGVGTGKTGLAEIVVGLKKPDRGRIWRNGEVAYVPQQFMLYKDLTVRENMEFTCGINNFSPIGIDAILEETGLGGSAQIRVERLPGGLQKMLQYASALCRDFSVIVMDEPMLGLDDQLRGYVRKLIDQLTREGKGLLILTSIAAEADSCEQTYRLAAMVESVDPIWKPALYTEPGGVRE
jgi:ABC-type multidrug transport system ATPase subunit